MLSLRALFKPRQPTVSLIMRELTRPAPPPRAARRTAAASRRCHRDDFGAILALDFETATTNGNSICAVGAALMENRQVVDSAHWLVRPPEREFHFTRLHGIGWDDVAGQPAFPDIWDAVQARFPRADAFMAHNAGFDGRVLRETLCHYGRKPDRRPFFCTVAGARAAWPDLPNHKLPTVAAYLKIPLEHHRAESDARACAQIGLSVPAHCDWRSRQYGRAH